MIEDDGSDMFWGDSGDVLGIMLDVAGMFCLGYFELYVFSGFSRYFIYDFWR